MDELLQDVLYPVMLGANTACHAAVRQLQKRFGTDCVVLTGKRALTLRFMPGVRLIDAPATLTDDLLLQILADLETDIRYAVPLLILCDNAYEAFWQRNRSVLETHYVLRRVTDIQGGRRE